MTCLGAQLIAGSSGSRNGRGIGIGSQQDMQLDYTMMQSVAEQKGLAIVDVPMDGDCALHAVIRQLQQQAVHSYDVRKLRQLATEHLESNPDLVNCTLLSSCYAGDIKAYLRQQALQGTLCDEAMIHAVAVVTRTGISVFDDNGSRTKFEPSVTYRGQLITLGRIAGAHYVSLEPRRGAATSKDRNKPNEFPITEGASAAHDDRFKDREQGDSRKENQEARLRYCYSKLKSEAEKRGLDVVDVPQSGNSAFHAVVRQLRLQNNRLFDVTTLRQRAVDYLSSHKHLINGNFSQMQSYLSAQSAPGTHCDEIMLSAIAEVITKKIRVLGDDGHWKEFGLQTSHTRSVVIGVYAKEHYVSLEGSDSKHEYETINDVDTEPGHDIRHIVSPVKPSQHQDEVAIQYASPSAADAGTDKPLAPANDTCAICMDVVKDPKTLPCTHVFCSQCIGQSLAYQPKCPCCGKILGVLKGDQPEGGTMRVNRSKWFDLEGYPKCGRIVIDYYIPDGRQKV